MRLLALVLCGVLATAIPDAAAHETGDGDHDHSFDASDPTNDPTLRAMSMPHVMANPHMRMTARRPAASEDQERADKILAILRQAIEKYKDSDLAERDGYKPFMPNLRLPVYHFTNKRYGAESVFRFDPEHPTSLLYKRTLREYELIGAMYTAAGRATEEQLDARVPLSVGQWHLHVNICAEPGGHGLVSRDRRFGLAGSIATREECDALNGRFLPRIFGWMLHVQPFEPDPKDIWGHHN
jgi:hypothetical protein